MKNLSIKFKLLTLMALSIATLLVIGLGSDYGTRKLSNSMDSIGDVRLPSIIGLSMMNEGLTAIRLANRDMMFFRDDFKAQEKFAGILKKKQDIMLQIDKGWAIYEPLPQESEEAKVWKEFVPAWDAWKKSQVEVDIIIDHLAKNQTEEGQKQLFNDYLKQLDLRKNMASDAKKLLNELIELNQNYANDDNYKADEMVVQLRSLIIFMALLSIVVVGFVGSIIVRSISSPLVQGIELAKKIANGELNNEIEIDRNDEIGQLLQAMHTMQAALSQLILEIDDSVKAAVNGDFSKRINLANHKGFAKNLGESINRLNQTTEAGLNDVTRVALALADGDLSQHITDEYPGVFGQTKDGVNKTVDSLTKIVGEMRQLVDAAANRGDFTFKMVIGSKAGYARDLSELLNRLSDVTQTGLDDVQHVVEALAKGDLTQMITRDYPGVFGQVKESVNGTVENIKSLLSEIISASDTITVAAKEIASGNGDLSHRTEEQAASLEQTAASMEELTTAVQANTENAKLANHLAIGASDVAGKGVAVVQKVIDTMHDINNSSRKISEIIAVIDGIAFQTNILALNAAVEAARAGDQGRGFAVVAGEVRNLAQRAASAAGEIKILIGDSEDKVEDGSKLVAQAGRTMEEIVASIRRVTMIMSEISDASVEQSSGITQVNQAIAQMDDVTQQNAALVEQATAAAESMAEQAQNLSTTVDVFKLSNEQERRSTHTPHVTIPSPAPGKLETYKPKKISTPALAITDSDEWEEF